MARKLSLLLGLCGLGVAAVPPADGQAPTPDGAKPPPPFPKRHGEGAEMRRPSPADMEKFENVRKAIEALTPEQQKRFQENFLRWSNLSPEEKKALADRDTFRRKKIAEEITAALTDAGLELDAERRELFAKRYGEERHKIEEQLRKEIDEKRQPLLKEVIAKLKAEFSANAPANPDAVKAPEKP